MAKATGDLTIYTAAECCAQLRSLIGAHTNIELDLSDVSEIDTAGVQLLIQARRESEAHGKSMQLVSPSPAVQEIVQLLQLHELLSVPSGEPTPPTGQDDAS